jgi:hypothetical protein
MPFLQVVTLKFVQGHPTWGDLVDDNAANHWSMAGSLIARSRISSSMPTLTSIVCTARSANHAE